MLVSFPGNNQIRKRCYSFPIKISIWCWAQRVSLSFPLRSIKSGDRFSPLPTPYQFLVWSHWHSTTQEQALGVLSPFSLLHLRPVNFLETEDNSLLNVLDPLEIWHVVCAQIRCPGTPAPPPDLYPEHRVPSMFLDGPLPRLYTQEFVSLH